ncbi:hypothetical protein M758_11G134400 [Ceratodon purpureus]|uniref:Uncharacterized protein n=1 Tax=Ceratodon purpureus TaxID=3225 RepID=A0A8T0GER4_CERPU|nr:hypothetical protein KC19_11G138000 [Ceratodon purpureus]KAG0601714.1 hypothetical protein M758_11G134400 [Ceratodon purpureus]
MMEGGVFRHLTREEMKATLHSYHPNRFLATPKGRKVMKTMNTFKITILCGFITILVLRGTLGPGGMFGESAPQVSYQAELRKEIIRSQRARVLAQVEEAVADEVTASKFVEEEKWDPSTPYRLGPKISDWDSQREAWNGLNPGRNVTVSGKAKTLLVSGSQPGPCANPMGDFYHLKFLKNRIDYARLHGLEFFYNMATFEKEMSSFWAKLPLLRKVMLNHPDVEWVWWMDSDAIFTDMTFEMPMEKYGKSNLIVHGFHNLLYEQHRWIGLNTGSFLIRNCQWSLDLLDALAPFGPEGSARVEAGKLFTEKLVDRPAFEADDQSALVYLILYGDPKWKEYTHLEWEFFLHGYWKYVVYNYEELMAKNHPGYGDERWPFVTHFVGCKPCKVGESEDGENDECFIQMERAFNFADNQVLEKYGYTHSALSSFMTHKIRRDTSDPLGLQHLSARRSKLAAAKQDTKKGLIEQKRAQEVLKETDLDE